MKFTELTKQETDEICKLFLDHCCKEHKIASVTWDGECFVFADHDRCTHYYKPPIEVPDDAKQVDLTFVKTIRHGDTMAIKPSKPAQNRL